MKYALVENGIVVNNIALNLKNVNDFPNAIYAEDIAVSIGDIYNAEDGYFYHNGERILSLDERVNNAEAALAVLLGGI